MILKMQSGKLWAILAFFLVFGSWNLAYGQQTVSGTVTDAQSGDTLPGVNILVKGTTTGTSTDAKGNFELTVPSLQDTLVVSYIGNQTKDVAINGRTSIDIALKSQTIAGEELVVVGYGTQEKKSLTGSVSQISGEEIENLPVTSTSEALQGKLPGVTVQQTSGAPGSNANITIRGLSSLNSGGPLVIVDGVPGSLNSIDPSNIESISVLKDASAAAIYGARAAAGVILITTKEGSAEGLKVQYQSNVSMKRPTRFPEKNGAVQNAKLANMAFTNAGSSPLFPQRFIDLMKDPSVKAMPKDDGSGWDYVADFDWGDYFLDQSFQQHHNMTISGGGERNSYLLSGSWTDENGYFSEYGPDNFDRYNLRFNFSSELIPNKLSLDSKLSLVRS